MTDIDRIKQKLNKDGWVLFNNPNQDEILLEIASKIGNIMLHPNKKRIDYLTPKDKSKAIKNTFSHKYGFERFPFHTDTAFWNTPCRYVLMSSENISSTETLVLTLEELNNLSTEEINVLEKSIFVVNTNLSSFYCTIINRINGISFIRFDTNTMKPMNSSAKKAILIFEDIINKSKIHKIKWDNHKILLLNNWKVLHSRSSVNYDEKRILKRIYIS